MPDSTRVTYDLLKDEWSRLKKVEKTSIDLMHKSNPYRISYCFEEKKEFNPETFDISSIKGIRIK